MHYQRTENGFVIEAGSKYSHQKVRRFLDDLSLSRPMRYALIQQHHMLVNDRQVKSEEEFLNSDDRITLVVPPEQIDWPCADHPCQVVYENDFVYVVHKDAGTIIYDDVRSADCLNGQAAAWLQEKGLQTPVRPLHRLDKDTSGLVLYSKVPLFQAGLDEQMASHRISRQYLAICTGKQIPVGTSFVIDDRIGRDRHHSGQYIVSASGKDARTRVTCLARKGNYLLFGCQLDTGRTHQIRVHLSSHGWPLVNDPLYGHRSADFEGLGLWACSITFHDPITNKRHKIHDLDNPAFHFFPLDDIQY